MEKRKVSRFDPIGSFRCGVWALRIPRHKHWRPVISDKSTSFDPADYLDTEEAREAYLVDAEGMQDSDYLEHAHQTVARSRTRDKAISERTSRLCEWQRVEQIWLNPDQAL